MNEGFATDAWIYEKLSLDNVIADSDISGKIFKGVVPQGANYPAIRYFVVRNETKQTNDNRKVWHSMTYQIEAIDKGAHFGGIVRVANRIDELFDRRGHIGDVIIVDSVNFNILTSIRDAFGGTINEDYTIGSDMFQQIGGVYTIRVQET